MWLYGRMEKISYSERITNYEISTNIGETRSIFEVIMTRKKKWIGHKDVTKERMWGKRPRGRPRMGMLQEYAAMKENILEKCI